MAELFGVMIGERAQTTRTGTTRMDVSIATHFGKVKLTAFRLTAKPAKSAEDFRFVVTVSDGAFMDANKPVLNSTLAELQNPEEPKDELRMTHQQFREQYENRVTFVCDCGAEIVMGMCQKWEDVPDGVENPHYPHGTYRGGI